MIWYRNFRANIPVCLGTPGFCFYARFCAGIHGTFMVATNLRILSVHYVFSYQIIYASMLSMWFSSHLVEITSELIKSTLHM